MPRGARSTAVKRNAQGKLVSKRSKTGDSACSAAMSAWKTTGMTPAIAAVLGKCRAKARAMREASTQRAVGNEGRAQALESRIARDKPLTQKARMARAKELRAQRAAPKAAPAPAVAGPTPDRATPRRRNQPLTYASPEMRRFGQSSATVRSSVEYRGYRIAKPVKNVHEVIDPSGKVVSQVGGEKGAIAAVDKARLARAAELRAQRASGGAKVAPAPRAMAPGRGTEKRLAAAEALRDARSRLANSKQWDRKPTPSSPGSLVYDKNDREMLKTTAKHLRENPSIGLRRVKDSIREQAANAASHRGGQKLNAMLLALESTRKNRIAARSRAQRATPPPQPPAGPTLREMADAARASAQRNRYYFTPQTQADRVSAMANRIQTRASRHAATVRTAGDEYSARQMAIQSPPPAVYRSKAAMRRFADEQRSAMAEIQSRIDAARRKAARSEKRARQMDSILRRLA